MNEQNPQPSSFLSTPPEGGNRTLLLIASFFIPVIGIILGIIFMTKPDEESRKFGRQALIAALAFFVLFCVCFACYFIFVFGMTFFPLLLVPTNSGSFIFLLA
ncbi:MAG: hypothetical protein OHK003_22250 [Anaerolineales bacterium]